ncbi:MAG: hypothetical protein ACN4GR_02420 [Arenicellales bacterium]
MFKRSSPAAPRSLVYLAVRLPMATYNGFDTHNPMASACPKYRACCAIHINR